MPGFDLGILRTGLLHSSFRSPRVSLSQSTKKLHLSHSRLQSPLLPRFVFHVAHPTEGIVCVTPSSAFFDLGSLCEAQVLATRGIESSWIESSERDQSTVSHGVCGSHVLDSGRCEWGHVHRAQRPSREGDCARGVAARSRHARHLVRCHHVRVQSGWRFWPWHRFCHPRNTSVYAWVLLH